MINIKLYEDNIKNIYDSNVNDVNSIEGMNDLLLKQSIYYQIKLKK